MKKWFITGAAALMSLALLGAAALGMAENTEVPALTDPSIIKCVQIQFEDGKTVDVQLKAELADKLTVRELYELAYQQYLQGSDNLTLEDYQGADEQ